MKIDWGLETCDAFFLVDAAFIGSDVGTKARDMCKKHTNRKTIWKNEWTENSLDTPEVQTLNPKLQNPNPSALPSFIMFRGVAGP